MKYYKSLTVIFIVVLAVFFAVPGTVGAYTFSLEITDINDAPRTEFLPGERVKVNVVLDDRSFVAGCALTLNYDTAVFIPPTTTADAVATPADDVAFSLIPAGNQDFDTTHRVNAAESGKIYLSGIAINTGTAINPGDGGAITIPGPVNLFTVLFTVKPDVAVLSGFDFSLTQTELFKPVAGYGIDANDDGVFDQGVDSKGKVPVLVGAVANTDADEWSDLELAFPVLLSDVTVPAFNAVQSASLRIAYPFLTIPGLPQGYAEGEPATYPLLTLGQVANFTVADGTRTYDWSVKDWEGNPVAGAFGTGVTAISIDPDDLFNDGGGAGIYQVTVIDSEIPTRTFSFHVRIPMKITPMEGRTYEVSGSNVNVPFTVAGGPGGNVYLYSALDLDGVAVTAANCGEFDDPNPTGSANIFGLTGTIPEMKTFQVVVSLDDRQDDPDVERLKEAALDTVKTLFHQAVPILAFSGTVVSDSVGQLLNGKVTAKYKPSIATAIQSNGTFDFSNSGANDSGQAESFRKIPGVIYRFFVSADNHVAKEVTGDDLVAGVVLERLPNTDAISGTVTLTGDVWPFEDTTAVVISAAADEDPILDGNGLPDRTLVNPADGS
jgi:hypothetical protein